MNFRRAVIWGALALLGGVVANAPAQPRTLGSGDSIAWFQGHQIDLSQGWGEARACFVDEAAADIECFRDQAALDSRERELAANSANPDISCSSPLKLFADTSYGGRELDFYDRGFWQNLSDWSFDDQTSSYKVGACSVDLADGANGGSPFYPGDTSAGHNEPSMSSGWDNRISSIYIA